MLIFAKKKAHIIKRYVLFGTRGTRTPYLLLRRQLLYPDELWTHDHNISEKINYVKTCSPFLCIYFKDFYFFRNSFLVILVLTRLYWYNQNKIKKFSIKFCTFLLILQKDVLNIIKNILRCRNYCLRPSRNYSS